MVGRRPKRAAIDEALEQLLGQRVGATLFIEGELGIGKSALARYAARTARQRRARVLRVGAGTIERGTPDQPWSPLLKALLKDVTSPEQLAELFGEGHRSPALLPLLNPFLAYSLPKTAETRASSGEARSEQLNALISLGLRRLAETSPTVLIVEDAQWFDSMSWAVLARLVADDPAPPLLTIVTERVGRSEGELPSERDRVRGGSSARVIALGPLSAEDTTALVRQRLGTESVDPDMLRLVVERVTGHPFFCEALLEMLIQSGAIQVTGTGGRLAPRADVGVPASIESAILGQYAGCRPRSS